MKRVLLLMFLLFFTFNVFAVNDVRIYQIYAGGGNTSATYNEDFVALYNSSNSIVNLDGWSLQYASRNSSSWNKLDINSISIGANSFILISIYTNGTIGTNLPTPDLTWSFGGGSSDGLAESAGKVALMDNQTLINTASPSSPIDFVGYGNNANASATDDVNGYETSPALNSAMNSTRSYVRKNDGQDTDDNSADFINSNNSPPNAIRPLNSGSFPLKLLALSVSEFSINKSQLLWQTTSESNFSHFEIQRSSDAKSFEPIGNIKGKGSENEIVEYSFIDEKPFEGLNYYRLKQVDIDNTFEFSKIVSLNIFKEAKLLVYPNPTSEKLKFTNVELEDINSVKIYNFAGKLLYDKHIESLELDLTGISPQNLLIEINLKDNTSIKRRIVKL